MYDYDRIRKAKGPTMDLHSKWRAVVDRHESAMNQEFFRLLQQTTDYLHSVGMDLIIDKSFLGKTYKGSDGYQPQGMLIVREREENTTSSPDARAAARWVNTALGIYGTARLLKSGPEKNRGGEPIKTWEIDLSE